MGDSQLTSIDYIFNHVILPPKLPHFPEDDELKQSAEQAMLTLLRSQLKAYLQPLARDSKQYQVWTTVDKMLGSLLTLTSSPTLTADLLSNVFGNMEVNGK